ncbi:MAG TPA: DUF3592 domain-containing protein [Terracidiphilus sp.]|nr:DUF3592 domain-containing protein [Terracidiphilus sp.]
MASSGCLTGTVIADMLFLRGGRPLTRFDAILISLFIGIVMLVAIFRAILGTWIKRTRGRRWPTVSANIDIVSVADVTDDARYPSYLATLTYLYRNPEQQMGDYSRRFGNKDDAQVWANSYKGETVKVHVDPRDPTRSVLREEDL